jgi:hypothetical protein
MSIYSDGETVVKGGYYLNKKTLVLESVSGSSGNLEAGTWVKIPTAAVVPLVLILSLAFVMFLPVLGFALLGYRIWASLFRASRAPRAV